MISFIPANGTTPQQVPLNAGQTVVYRNVLDSLWISQSADGTSGYRTNVAVVFPDAGGGAATVSVYDADGDLARTQELNLERRDLASLREGVRGLLCDLEELSDLGNVEHLVVRHIPSLRINKSRGK
jgi:hypothetical protein